MASKILVMFTKVLIQVLSHLMAPEIRISLQLNPMNWSLHFGVYYIHNEGHEGKTGILILPMGQIRIEYADAGIVAHNLQHEIVARIEANLLKSGETLQSAGFGELELTCGKH